MKKLTILLFSILISFNSYGKWTEVIESTSGVSFYIDVDTIKENSGYVYYWSLVENLKPDYAGNMSTKLYKQGDCEANRYKSLSAIFYKLPMGGGAGKTFIPSDKWVYLTPESLGGKFLNEVCDYVRLKL
jgi:hypothetical protein